MKYFGTSSPQKHWATLSVMPTGTHSSSRSTRIGVKNVSDSQSWTIIFFFFDNFTISHCICRTILLCGYSMPSGANNPFSCFGTGNCVWWAVYKRNDLNFMYHSPDTAQYPNYWVNTAKSHGYDVVTKPAKGAIVVYKRGSTWGNYGHVAYVESVSGNQYTVTEMGYNEWNCVRTRTRTTGQYDEEYIYDKTGTDPVPCAIIIKSLKWCNRRFSFKRRILTGAMSAATQVLPIYRIVVSTDSSFNNYNDDEKQCTSSSSCKTDTTSSSSHPGFSLEAERTYYWKVRAGNVNAGGDWSSVRSFTTKTDYDPFPAPSLSSPSNGAHRRFSFNAEF